MNRSAFFKFSILIILLIPQMLVSNCGSASCPLNNYRYLHAGLFQIGFTREYINQDQIYLGSQRSFVGAIPYHHDEVQTINDRSIVQMQLGFSDRLGLGLDIPFVSRQHSHIHHHQGEDLWESWSFSGLGDMIVSAQYSILLPESEFDPYLGIHAGVKLATGVTDVRNAEGEAAEVSIQPGSGSTDGIVGLHFRQTIASVPTLSGDFSSLPLAAGVSYQFTGVGTDGWRFGNTLLVHAGTSYQFSHRATLLFQVNGKFQGYADVGLTGEPGENTGGTWIYTSPGLSLEVNDAIAVLGYIQLPVYQKVNGIQQAAAFNIQFGISANIGLLD
ncbi:MAG: hypothetical protein WBD36_06580 [Bacteroidota bacterium]